MSNLRFIYSSREPFTTLPGNLAGQVVADYDHSIPNENKKRDVSGLPWLIQVGLETSSGDGFPAGLERSLSLYALCENRHSYQLKIYSNGKVETKRLQAIEQKISKK